MNPTLLILLLFMPLSKCLQCYSGSNLQVLECPSLSCIKQTLGVDTVRYCDGSDTASVCQTFRIFETCDMIPNLGFICCCSGNLCNSSRSHWSTVPVVLPVLFLLLRYFGII